MTYRKSFFENKESIAMKTKNVITIFVTMCIELGLLACVNYTLLAGIKRLILNPLKQGAKHA